jgi:hypothetical protein
MPVLNNVKHERFANHIAGGMTQAEAYKASGFRAKHLSSAACKLAGKPQVAARIEELKGRIAKATVKRVAERVAITKETVIQELWDNVQRGKEVKGGSAVVNRALELLGKELGMFSDAPAPLPVSIKDLPDETIRSMLDEVEAEIAAQTRDKVQ